MLQADQIREALSLLTVVSHGSFWSVAPFSREGAEPVDEMLVTNRKGRWPVLPLGRPNQGTTANGLNVGRGPTFVLA